MGKYRFRADYRKFGGRRWYKIDTFLFLSDDEVEMALKAGPEFLKVMMEKDNLPDGEYYVGCLDIPITTEVKKEVTMNGAYICTCGHWGFNILDGEIACLGCNKKHVLKRFKRLNGTIVSILEKPETFNKRIRKEEDK